MAPAFLILHGIENHRPPEHWQFWLAKQLRELGHAVAYPALPDPDTPYYPAWAAELRGLLKGFDGAPRTVVCHSLACLLWLRAAAEVVRSPVDRLLLVSPPASASVPETGASFRLERLDIAAVRATVTAELAIACSDVDPYNPEGAQRLYGDALGVDAHVLPGAGHITPDDGYGPWPWALQWCLAFEGVPA
jgi:hypothetical protein